MQMYKHFLSIKSYSCNSLVITLPTRQKKTSICNNNPCIPRTSKMYHKSTQSRNSPLETLLSKVGEFLSSFTTRFRFFEIVDRLAHRLLILEGNIESSLNREESFSSMRGNCIYHFVTRDLHSSWKTCPFSYYLSVSRKEP